MLADMLIIIIGINCALQIDNWKENVNNKRAEIELYKIRGFIDNELSKADI